MTPEIGILTQDQVTRLSNILRSRSTMGQAGLEWLAIGNIKYFIESKDHLYNIYNFRLRNTSKAPLKTQLKQLVENIDSFEGNSILVSFVGLEDNRVLIFSDVGIQLLLGIIYKV